MNEKEILMQVLESLARIEKMLTEYINEQKTKEAARRMYYQALREEHYDVEEEWEEDL